MPVVVRQARMVQTLLNSLEAAMDVPVILQRRWVATVKCLRLSSSPEFVDIPVA